VSTVIVMSAKTQKTGKKLNVTMKFAVLKALVQI